RLACGVSRDGSKASNVARAARAYGLTARGCRMEPEELRGLPLPLIVFWNFNHFVVVDGFGTEKVYLNDPASGPRAVSWAEFGRSFTGMALVVGKGPEFRPGGELPRLSDALARRLSGSGLALTFALLTGLALILPGLIVPAFIRVFVDRYLVAGSE